MDWKGEFSLDWSTLVYGLANDVLDRLDDQYHNSTKTFWADRNRNWGTSVNDLLSAGKSFSSVHCNCAHGVFTYC